MKEICPKSFGCKLFNGEILKRKESAEAYINLYCCSEQKHKECKRYLVSEKLGRCDDFVMPNSKLTIDEIMEKMNVRQN